MIVLRTVLLTFFVLHEWAAFATAIEPKQWINQNLDETVQLYQHFHAHPELSFHEEKTAARLAAEWRSIGARVTEGVGGHGVVAVLSNGDGPTLMLRTDMDALPVREKTGLVYASRVRETDQNGTEVDVMHACGHDIHMANIVAVARYMAAHKERWRGTLLMIGQPAEERGAGAKAMLDDGLFERFQKPDYALALHVDAFSPCGQVGYRMGFSQANVDSVDITVKGRGGHGAHPHTTVDPIVQAAELVLSLQTIVSREVEPIAPAVITVGSIHGGTKHNIISDSCHLQLTVRSYSNEVRRLLLESIRRKAEAVAMAYGGSEPEVKISEGTPSLWNDHELAQRVSAVFRRSLGDENVKVSDQSMGGEDFSRYGKAGVPILMFRLGAVDGKRLERFEQLGQSPPSLHSPMFYPDAAETLVTGVTVMASAALELLKP